MTPRDIEKLRAIGYAVPFDGVAYDCCLNGTDINEYRDWELESMAWGACKAHAQSPGGMKATMADKVRWLLESGASLTFKQTQEHHMKAMSFGLDVSKVDVRTPDGWFEAFDWNAAPEFCVDALFWKVP